MSADTFYGSDFGALESFDPEIAGVLGIDAQHVIDLAAAPFLRGEFVVTRITTSAA